MSEHFWSLNEIVITQICVTKTVFGSQNCFILPILYNIMPTCAKLGNGSMLLGSTRIDTIARVASSTVQCRENRSLEEILNFISERDILSWRIINGNPAVFQVLERSYVRQIPISSCFGFVCLTESRNCV